MPQYDRVLPRGVEGLFRRVMRLCRGMLCFWVLVMQGRRVHVALSRGRLLQFPFHYVLKQTSDDRAQRSNYFGGQYRGVRSTKYTTHSFSGRGNNGAIDGWSSATTGQKSNVGR